jgi:RNA polymerase sigma-70 factor (ECF subfamily)
MGSKPMHIECEHLAKIRAFASGRREAKASVAIIARMPLEQFTDEELVLRYRAAHVQDAEQYINELFRRNQQKVARWCMRFTDDRESALDLSQEVFAKAFQNLHSFKGDSKFSTWLFIVARNHCLNAVRTRSIVGQSDSDEELLATLPDHNFEHPDEAMDREKSMGLARQIISEALDETEKRVFVLHYAEEMTLDAITRLLQLENASGAKAFLVSAKRKLNRVIERRKVRSHQGRV